MLVPLILINFYQKYCLNYYNLPKKLKYYKFICKSLQIYKVWYLKFNKIIKYYLLILLFVNLFNLISHTHLRLTPHLKAVDLKYIYISIIRKIYSHLLFNVYLNLLKTTIVLRNLKNVTYRFDTFHKKKKRFYFHIYIL